MAYGNKQPRHYIILPNFALVDFSQPAQRIIFIIYSSISTTQISIYVAIILSSILISEIVLGVSQKTIWIFSIFQLPFATRYWLAIASYMTLSIVRN